jgi:hypothetical protein
LSGARWYREQRSFAAAVNELALDCQCSLPFSILLDFRKHLLDFRLEFIVGNIFECFDKLLARFNLSIPVPQAPHIIHRDESHRRGAVLFDEDPALAARHPIHDLAEMLADTRGRHHFRVIGIGF